MFNNIISNYTKGAYTFDTLTEANAGGLIEPAYLNGLVRMLVNEVLTLKRFTNKFSQFKVKRPFSGKIINSVYVNPVTGKAFTVDGLTKLFDLAPADVKGAIRKYTVPLQYDVTYNKDELYKAFANESSLVDFINLIVNSLYNGSEIDDKAQFVSMFSDLYNENLAKIIKFAKVDATNIEEFAVQLKTVVENFKEESVLYNVWKRLNPTDTSAVFWSNPGDINIILPISISARLDVELYAKLFNVDRAEIDGRVFTIADDKLPTGVQAIVFDSTLVSIDEIYAELEPTFYDATLRRYKEVYNTNAEYGMNPFANCVIIAIDIPDITATTVRSKTVSVVSAEATKTPLEITPIGANHAIAAVVSDADHMTATVTYSIDNGYELTVTSTVAGTVTFTGITGTITVSVQA